MASYNSIYKQVANLHKDWAPDVVEALAEDLYQDALDREAEYECECDFDEEW